MDKNIYEIHTIQDPIAVLEIEISDYGKSDQFSYSTYGINKTEHIAFNKSAGVILKELGDKHRHDYFELLFIISGTITIVIEDSTNIYHSGDVCIINRNTRHRELLNGNCVMRYICIKKNFFQTPINNLNNFLHSKRVIEFFQRNISTQLSHNKSYIDFIFCGETIEKLLDLSNQLIDLIVKQPVGQNFMIPGILNQIFAIFDESRTYKVQYRNLGEFNEESIAEDIMQYVSTNVKKVSAESIADHLCYNKDYLNRVFKKQTGVTLHEYVINICMNEAARLLDTTNYTVSEITVMLGYENRTNFNRQFKMFYGVSPGEYKKR